MIYSTSSIMAVMRFGSEYFFVKKHVVYFVVGLAALLAAIKIPYRFYFKAAYPVLAISAIALICIYIPGLGVKVGGAKRWVRFGSLTFQPSERLLCSLRIRLRQKATEYGNSQQGFCRILYCRAL
jgi:cell division protein FtsW